MIVKEYGMQDTKNGVKWAVSSQVRVISTQDGGVLLDLNKGLCYSLNPVGAKIWQAIESRDGYAILEDIIDGLAPQFTVSPEQLARDMDEYLRDLQKKGLIKAAGYVQAPKTY